MSLTIFVESDAPKEKRDRGLKTNEQHFMEQYVEHINDTAEVNIIGVGGKDHLPAFKNIMLDNTRSGGTNLVIFDCDYSVNGGGILNKRAWIEKIKRDNGVDFDYFFFPNNKDEGDFEVMLLNIINKEHECILDCFDAFEMCISGHNNDGKDIYESPNLKAKMYTYIATFKMDDGGKSVKQGNWHFNDERYWNLDSPYLNPLKEFLRKYLPTP